MTKNFSEKPRLRLTLTGWTRKIIAELYQSTSYVMQRRGLAFSGRWPRTVRSSASHPLLDQSWYLEQNPDVAEAEIDPLVHYLSTGATEGRDPNPLFDTSWYLQQNPDVGEVGTNPVVHYLNAGAAEGRDPNPLFDTSWYLEHNPDVAHAGVNPLVHYLRAGALEGRDPHPLFDTSWYLEHNPDVAEADLNPLAHYLRIGALEGRDPHPLFDTRWYLERYPDVAEAGLDALLHYLSTGAVEGRDPSILFDTSWYLERNPHVFGSGLDPLSHYATIGAKEVNDPHPLFDARWYSDSNPEVADKGLNPLAHYMNKDVSERDNPNPFFDSDWYSERFIQRDDRYRYALEHYVLHGAVWFADPGPNFSSRYYVEANGLSITNIGDPLAHYLSVGRKRRLRIAPVPMRPDEWRAPKGQAWSESFQARMRERIAALTHADPSRPFSDERITFSITTTVYDTDPDFLVELAATIAQQAFSDYEWLILDNGSHTPGTIEACSRIAASDVRIRLFRVEENLHIVGGNRYLLARAAGRYVVPVDSDDVLYPDTLSVLADALRTEAHEPPSIVYSDEQKIDLDGTPLELIWRRPFSFASALSTVPAAHLLIFDRERGLAAGVYTDDGALGCHDWDTALRLTERGGKALHVPEVLYGWRMHEQSTALYTGAKTYIGDSQVHVIDGALKRSGLEDRFRVEPQVEGLPGWYKVARTEQRLPAVAIDLVIPWDAEDLGSSEHNLWLLSTRDVASRVLYPAKLESEISTLRRNFENAAWTWQAFDSPDALIDAVNTAGPDLFAKALVTSYVRLKHANAVIQAVGLLELDSRAGIVGGCLTLPGGMILSGGLVAGLNGFIGAVYQGWPTIAGPWTDLEIRQRVSAFPAAALCVRADLLRSGCRLSGFDRYDALNGIAFCLEGDRLGYASVLDANMEGEVLDLMTPQGGMDEPRTIDLRSRFAKVIARPSISPHLSSRGSHFGSLPSPGEIGERCREAFPSAEMPASI